MLEQNKMNSKYAIGDLYEHSIKRGSSYSGLYILLDANGVTVPLAIGGAGPIITFWHVAAERKQSFFSSYVDKYLTKLC